MIQLTDRNKDYNSFWFSFFHELGHILKHKKSDVFLEGLKDIQQDNDKEAEADAFAKKYLDISIDELIKFKLLNTIEKKKAINSLASKLKINQSIIVSQLQRVKLIPYNDLEMNQLKLKVQF
jgi:Zn-dependent peptidase ImmA (M78 family)